MAAYVILGHGGFNPDSGGYAPEVLVPPDTTLQFFADAGQALVLPSGDYTDVASMWEQGAAEGSPIPAGWVTYNYRLTPDTTEGHRDSARNADWGEGVSIVFVESGDAFLCTGTEDACPTPALRVQQQQYDETGEGDPVEDDRWNHHCDGILGELAGNEIYWLACASISSRVDQSFMPSLDTSDVSGPGAADVSTWIPDDAAYEEIARLNAQNVKNTEDGEQVSVVVGGAVVLVGGDHARRPADYVRRQENIEEGVIVVTKGSTFSAGTLEVYGITASQRLVKDALESFSDKKVRFR